MEGEVAETGAMCELAIPTCPGRFVEEVLWDKNVVFKSALSPLAIACAMQDRKQEPSWKEQVVREGQQGGRQDEVRVIFKRGDDLRQDKVVMQVMSKMQGGI